jgi:hypothetical protein
MVSMYIHCIVMTNQFNIPNVINTVWHDKLMIIIVILNLDFISVSLELGKILSWQKIGVMITVYMYIYIDMYTIVTYSNVWPSLTSNTCWYNECFDTVVCIIQLCIWSTAVCNQYIKTNLYHQYTFNDNRIVINSTDI